MLMLECASSREIIAEQTLASVLASIASGKPAPGSGVAGAIALSLACATARKALSLSLKHHPDRTELAKCDTRLSAVGDAALLAADRDAHEFARFIVAQQEGADHDLQKQAGVLIDLSDEMSVLCRDVADVVRAISEKVMTSVKNDVLAAQMLCTCADTINRANGQEMRAFLD